MTKALPILLIVFAATTARAGDADFDARVRALLEQRSPEAAAAFRDADAARAAGDLVRAAAGYRRVLELEPDFSHAARRLCQALAEHGEHGAAVTECRRAVAMERSAENLGSLAMVLVHMGEGGEQAEVTEALRLARDAVRADPASVSTQNVLCQVAIVANEAATLARCVDQLERVAADDWMTHMFAASLAVARKQWGPARAALERAKQRGMPAALYAEIDQSIAPHARGTPRWLWGVAAAGGLLVLVALAAWLRRRRRA